ncbi:hypothetical protein GOODEAATRI_025243 [Goodea atripinnis]|uniref:Uncharacterized protein n=1 Tax=Goodea atripinnis TaxID=208336 RepID=A0ABV0MKR8_9TELE
MQQPTLSHCLPYLRPRRWEASCPHQARHALFLFLQKKMHPMSHAAAVRLNRAHTNSSVASLDLMMHINDRTDAQRLSNTRSLSGAASSSVPTLLVLLLHSGRASKAEQHRGVKNRPDAL